MGDKILNKKAVARLLGRDVRSVDRYVALGRIPFCHVGRHILFSWAKLCQWLNPQAPPSSSDLDLEAEEKAELEKARRADEAEDRLRKRLIETERRVKLGQRAEKTIALGQRFMELGDKENLTPSEEDELAEVEEKLRVLGVEDSIELENERKEFLEFFCDLPAEEARRVFDLLRNC